MARPGPRMCNRTIIVEGGLVLAKGTVYRYTHLPDSCGDVSTAAKPSRL